MKFEQIAGVVADMDGVLWRGEMPLPGFKAFFDLMYDADLPFVLATNNSSKTPTMYVEKINRLGVDTIAENNIITSGTATIDTLLQEYPQGADIHVLGGAGLFQLVEEAGFTIVDNHADVVIVGLDFDINYDKLRTATNNVRDGARLIGTNGDVTFPTPDGLSPGNGSLVAAVASASEVEAEFIGKPHPPMFHTALRMLNTSPENTLMIGDRLNTDIEGAIAVHMKTALLLSGVSQPDDLVASAVQPDVAFEDLAALVKSWNYTGGKRKR